MAKRWTVRTSVQALLAGACLAAAPQSAADGTDMAANDRPMSTAAQMARDGEEKARPFRSEFGWASRLDGWNVSDFDAGSDIIDTRWYRQNLDVRGGAAHLTVTPLPVGATRSYASAELSRVRPTGYGRYEVILRPAEGSGLLTNFFTYTGPYFGDPHEEIGFGFRGSDTTSVGVHYRTEGGQGSDYRIDLGFDAAASFHLYAFEWTPTALRWYVDGRLVAETGAGDMPPPSRPAKLYTNVWVGAPGTENWLGPVDFSPGVSAEVRCVSYVPMGETGETCAQRFDR